MKIFSENQLSGKTYFYTIASRDANKKGDDAFAIFDPRNPLNKRRREADAKKKGQRW